MGKYDGKSIKKLNKRFFELANDDLIPELADHIEIALEKFEELQKDDSDLSEIIIVADVEERRFVFALGDGSDLESADDDCVFYIAKSDDFKKCMKLLEFICFGNHPEGTLRLDREVYHWIGDALQDVDCNVAVTIYGNYDYGESEVDPFLESTGEDYDDDEDEDFSITVDDDDDEEFTPPDNTPDLEHLDINYPADMLFAQDENPALTHFILEQFKRYMPADNKGIAFVDEILSEATAEDDPFIVNFVKVIADNLYLTFAKGFGAAQCYTMMIMPANEIVTGAFGEENGYSGKCSKELKFFVQDLISRLQG